jgi:hypothetical protein
MSVIEGIVNELDYLRLLLVVPTVWAIPAVPEVETQTGTADILLERNLPDVRYS